MAGTDDCFADLQSALWFQQLFHYPTTCTALSPPFCSSLLPSLESTHFILRFSEPKFAMLCQPYREGTLCAGVHGQGAEDRMGLSSEQVVVQEKES